MSTDKKPQNNTFCVSFNTMPGGYLKGVQIHITEVVLDAMDQARIDLADHPLYKQLQQYVLNNPR